MTDVPSAQDVCHMAALFQVRWYMFIRTGNVVDIACQYYPTILRGCLAMHACDRLNYVARQFQMLTGLV